MELFFFISSNIYILVFVYIQQAKITIFLISQYIGSNYKNVNIVYGKITVSDISGDKLKDIKRMTRSLLLIVKFTQISFESEHLLNRDVCSACT